MDLLLKRPWFRRIWILQEIANARVAIVQCGKKSVSARTFAQVPSLLGLKPDPHCQAVLDIMPGFSRKESWWSSQRDLRTLLEKFRASEATDKRDMFYALFGISSDASQNDTLRPDYSKPLQQVIEDVALFLTSATNHDDSSYGGFIHWSLPEFFQKLDSLHSAVLGVAAKHGKEAIVKSLLETRGVKMDMMDMAGFAPLHKATLYGHEAVVRQLIKNGANVNLPDGKGYTPLSLAVSRGHQAILKLLLATDNINPNARDREGYTALSTAVWYGDEAVVELLLATDGIDLSHTVEQISKWPLIVAKSSIGRRVGIAAAQMRF
jgi:hypothetical protein